MTQRYDALVYGLALEIVNFNGDSARVWRERPIKQRDMADRLRLHLLAVKVYTTAKSLTDAALIQAGNRLKMNRRRDDGMESA